MQKTLINFKLPKDSQTGSKERSVGKSKERSVETLVFFLSNVTCMYEVKFQKGGSKGPEIEILTVIIKLERVFQKIIFKPNEIIKRKATSAESGAASNKVR